MIEARHLTYHYPRAERPALNDLTLSIPAGQFCAVLGANGAGKSTLAYALTGFIPHFYRGRLEGKLEVAGNDVAQTPLAQLAGTVGFVFANPFNQITGAKFTVRQEIAFGLENLGVPPTEMAARVDEMLARMGLEEAADRSPIALSGGQQQRLAIASVLVMRPQVLVLDEPTSQLDPAGSEAIFRLLRTLAGDQEITIFLASHKVALIAEFADRALILSGGQIIDDGAPPAILADPGLERLGIIPSAYTELAHLARQRGLGNAGGPLPVTLAQAEAFFR